ncbi:hypothetical protein FACS1894204_08800 [Synergistales bacterium]|nr:hypothetical protein FACS1894204_08800 [Synergistales bacterium]
MSAQMYDSITYEEKDYWLAATPLEEHFAANPALRPKFVGFNSACARGYVAKWEIRDQRLCLVGMDMILETDAAFDSLFPDGVVFAGWVSGELTCPYGGLLKYDHAGFARTLEHELILSVENGILKSARVKDNV